jgi:hypothetical protein
MLGEFHEELGRVGHIGEEIMMFLDGPDLSLARGDGFCR